MSKITELRQDIADMKAAIKSAKDSKNESAVRDLEPTLLELEKELKEEEEAKETKTEKKPSAKKAEKKPAEKKAKAEKKPAAKKAESKEPAEKKTKELKKDRLFGSGQKFDLKIGEKVVLKDGTEILLEADDKCILKYKGDSKRTVVFVFEDGTWVIDCCEHGKKKYPEFNKGQIEEAVDYILEMLECREMTARKKKSRSKAKKAHAVPVSPAKKVEDVIEKAADKTEKVVEGLLKKGKSFSAPQLRDFAKEAKDLVMAIVSGIDNAKDKKTFISALRAVISQAEKKKITITKLADGGDIEIEDDDLVYEDDVITGFIEVTFPKKEKSKINSKLKKHGINYEDITTGSGDILTYKVSASDTFGDNADFESFIEGMGFLSVEQLASGGNVATDTHIGVGKYRVTGEITINGKEFKVDRTVDANDSDEAEFGVVNAYAKENGVQEFDVDSNLDSVKIKNFSKGGNPEIYQVEYYARVGEHGHTTQSSNFDTAYKDAIGLYKRTKKEKGLGSDLTYIGVSGNDKFAIVYIHEDYIDNTQENHFQTVSAYKSWMKVAKKALNTGKPQKGKY